MILKELKPRKALNKAFLKVKPNRTEIEGFKTNLITLLDRTNDTESEEFHKNLVSDFLKKTYYDPNHFINTKGKNDLVIHNGQHATTTVGVILEAKKPTNKAEMITTQKLNAKAFQELVLYYLRERITHKNLEVKHLVVTNINEWFIFDATLFDRLFAQNKNLVKQFTDFEGGRLADTKTDFFYKQIAEPFIDSIGSEIEFTYFNIQDYQKPLRNAGKADDNLLIALFKLLSPEHLLKLPFTNDSNSLDKRFYSELLYIIGLTETKEGSKKLIERNKQGERHTGTILEDTIIQLDSMDKLSRIAKPYQYGNTQQERLFNVALELSITWINRILFLKLLEAQLISYHKSSPNSGKGDQSYAFLNFDKIKEYDDLNSLFFQVLARKYEDRNEDVKKVFEKVPYLNSSLFEPTELEQVTLFISNLKDDKTIPVFSQTVLKDRQGKKRSGNISTLQYLFEFLDAYDFGAEGGEEIQEDNKTLINASVLGLIFEKINGYKDGSFFTPGFITMYMCRETIRKAVVQKFNEAYNSLLEESKAGLTPLLKGAGGVSKRREIIPYNPNLKELARDLRNNSTKSEILLWKELKGKFEGKYDFHRQKPLDNYIADFFCHELKLVIEIDGATHNWQETQQKDFEKECRLNELGLNVLRFSDDAVFNRLDATIETIKLYIEGFEKENLSEFIYEDTPLNSLSGNKPVYSTPLNSLSRADFKSLDDVYEQIGDDRLFTRQQANNIINSLKICDPAVGSGHFLVSALNEIIAVKNDLKILQDRDGKRLKEYQVEVVNDELIVTDEDGELFEYNPGSKGSPRASESQRIQETLFHEKQTIIENCLFGVDINPNSVKICRLRLWIELLKNAYYKHPPQEGNFPPLHGVEGNEGEAPPLRGAGHKTPHLKGVGEAPLLRGAGGVLETLPNIDINIKCGNSLVSRFAIDADLKQALKKSKWTIDSYRMAVATYRNAESKEQKREMERLIADIKSDFRSEISLNDPKAKKLRKLQGELFQMTNQGQLFEMSQKEKAEWNKKVQQLTEETKKLETEIEAIKANKIFENAFEWRFEFPEVLNDDGDFVGFDVVIGNPPYGVKPNEMGKEYFNSLYSATDDIYTLFIELGLKIISENSNISFINPITWLTGSKYRNTRNMFTGKNSLVKAINLPYDIFADAYVDTGIYFFQKKANEQSSVYEFNPKDKIQIEDLLNIEFRSLGRKVWASKPDLKINLNESDNSIFSKLDSIPSKLSDFSETARGILADKSSYKGESENGLKKVFTGNLNRYIIDEAFSFIQYDDRLKEKPKSYIFFTGERVLVRRIISRQFRMMATYTDKEFVCKKDIYIIKLNDDKISYKYVLALLNSKLLSFYKTKNSGSAKKDDFTQITLGDIRQLPIPKIESSKQQKFIKLVDEILIAKEQNEDSTIAENELDQLVYQLYDLTEEEIKIIETT